MRWVLTIGVIQSLVLGSLASREGSQFALQTVGACLAVVLLPLIVRRWLSESGCVSMVVSGALGGAGMLLGSLLDGSHLMSSAGCPSCAGGEGSFVSWMNGFMLLACVGGCRLVCPLCASVSTELVSQVFCVSGMMLGMLGGGRVLSLTFAEYFGIFAGQHIAMLVGMVIGVAMGNWVNHILMDRLAVSSLSARKKEAYIHQ